MRRRGNFAAEIASSFDPSCDCVLYVDDRLLRRLAIAHAAGKIGNGRKKAAAFFQRKWRDDDRVFEAVHGAGPHGVDEYDELKDIYGLYRAFEMYGVAR